MPSNNRSNQKMPSANFENSNMANSNHKRSSETNQKVAQPMRPQLPRDSSKDMERWQPGSLPKGGFRAVIDFSDSGVLNTKRSPTAGGGGKVY